MGKTKKQNKRVSEPEPTTEPSHLEDEPKEVKVEAENGVDQHQSEKKSKNTDEDTSEKKRKRKRKKKQQKEEEEKEEVEVEKDKNEENNDEDDQEMESNEQEDNNIPTMSYDTNKFLSEKTFDSLDISSDTKKGLKDMGLVQLTRIQELTIPHLLEGKDVNGRAKTGSGKTLAFLVPALENIIRTNHTSKQGTGVVIISPTRELSIQTHGVLKELLKYHPSLTHSLIMGGANRSIEADKLFKGIVFIVATPGRLLDHLRNSKGFVFKNLKTLIIDEADRILDIGFEEDMKQILQLLPQNRQSILFSATDSTKIQKLALISLKSKPVRVELIDKIASTVSTLEQGYIVCPSESRFLLLYTFLKKFRNSKTIVFFSSCKSVKYHSELLNYLDLPVLDLHGKQKQVKRTSTFFNFAKAKEAILLCTDVAARGLDIPAVDWIIQFDPPDDPTDYIHRVGRTARAGAQGKGLLFLLPEEIEFLKYLRRAGVSLNEYEFPLGKLLPIQSQLERLLEKSYDLHVASREAYRSYIYSYASHGHKNIFNVEALDLKRVSKQFGFTVPPQVDFKINSSGKQAKMRKRKSTVIAESTLREIIMTQKSKKHKSK